MNTPPFEFTNGIAARGNTLYLSGALDEKDEDDDYGHSLIITYNERYPDPWAFLKVDNWRNAALIRFNGPQPFMGFMSEEGEMVLFSVGEGSDWGSTERIPGAGLNLEDSVGWGYLMQLRQIGAHLYACGDGGQVYKRTGLNKWAHMDKGLLRDPSDLDCPLFSDINGPHESAIYAAGSMSSAGSPPFLAFWNGKSWREIDVSSVAAGFLNTIFVESETRIWICGENGTLLLGNVNDGFKSLSTVEDNQLLTSVTVFKGKVYLGSNLGPFVYDPNRHSDGIRPLETTLNPPLEDVGTVDTKDGVLWAIGAQNLARFDGTNWQRIQIPTNPNVQSCD